MRKDRDAVVRIILRTLGAHVSAHRCRAHFERMMNRAKRGGRAFLVATHEGEVRGFLYAECRSRYGLYEDGSAWYVHYLMGRGVLKALVEALIARRGRRGGDTVYVAVWDEFPRSAALRRALRLLGLSPAGTLMGS